MASKRRIRRNACRSKIAYSTMDSAWAAVRRTKKKDMYPSPLRPYQCSFCSLIHIGNKRRYT